MQRTLTAAVFTVIFAALAGCGQMGPLYMPPPGEPADAQPAPEQPPQPSQQEAAAP